METICSNETNIDEGCDVVARTKDEHIQDIRNIEWYSFKAGKSKGPGILITYIYSDKYKFYDSANDYRGKKTFFITCSEKIKSGCKARRSCLTGMGRTFWIMSW